MSAQTNREKLTLTLGDLVMGFGLDIQGVGSMSEGEWQSDREQALVIDSEV